MWWFIRTLKNKEAMSCCHDPGAHQGVQEGRLFVQLLLGYLLRLVHIGHVIIEQGQQFGVRRLSE